MISVIKSTENSYLSNRKDTVLKYHLGRIQSHQHRIATELKSLSFWYSMFLIIKSNIVAIIVLIKKYQKTK